MKNQQIVFVDSAVEDWQSLAVGVKAGMEIILVDRTRDGIEQIAEALQIRKGIESVHIISHGESGSLQLGPTSLNFDNLETYRDCLKRWFSSSVNSIKNRFEILLYGCNVAAGEKGEAFVQKLSKLTKANIAASSDITGSAQKGGNWILEYATGAIKTGLALEPEVMANYAHTLATFTVTNTADSGPGSLRDAITQANALAGADIINFNIPAAGVQTIAPLSSLPPITAAVTIDGFSQPGATSGNLLIELSGASAGPGINGILIIGSNSTVQGLTINRFTNSGIFIAGNTSTGNLVRGNYIGTNPAGTAALPNVSGVVVDNAPGNTIGGSTPADRNIISGNSLFGVWLNNTGAANNIVRGNYIGTNPAGTGALANGGTGIQVQGAPNNTIGGTNAADRNLISGNGSAGVFIDAATATGNTVLGNFIGTDINGTADLGNVGFGVMVQNAPNNTIGGNTAGARNIISGNNAFGVVIQNAPATSNAATGNRVVGNFIGTDVNGTADLGNTLTGVLIQDAASNTIGGTGAGDRNIISGNDGFGVQILNANATLNSVLGNYIGTNAAGTAALPNIIGVVVDNAPSNTIGGSVVGAGNIISGNSSPIAGLGVQITGASATGNTLRGNFIGVAANGTSPLGNSSIGVQITAAATNNAIGGTAAGEGNIIANNGNIGVAVASGTGNSIQNNSIFANLGLGIDLGNDSITANDPGDADTGANNLQNTPVLTTATASGGSVTVAGTYNSTPNTTFTLQFFANTPPDTQGQTFIASIPVTTDAAGNAAFNQTFPAAVTAGQLITATATDAAGNTSEFSAQPVPVVVPLSTITGIKFNDIDGNGTQAAGELGVAGVTVFLDTNGDGILSAGETSATTGADGSFTFGNLPAGTYSVREIVPAGSQITTVNPVAVTLAAGQTTPATVNFGNQAIAVPLSTIAGIKFNDIDGNGTQAAGELGVPGVTVFLDTNGDGILGAGETSATTDANGSFTFGNLPAGTYNVREVVPANSQPTTPNPVAVTLAAGQTTPATVNFGNRSTPAVLGSITGIKFNDIDGNGTQAAGEVGVPGVTVFLDTNNDGILGATETSATSDANGSFTFPNLASGTYNVREVVPPNSQPTTPNPVAVTLAAGQTTPATVNFGNQTIPAVLGSITGIKFNDIDGNGTQAAGEVGVPGVTVFLDTNNDGILDATETSATTDANGGFNFPNLPSGTYNVREVVPSLSQPTTPNPVSVTLAAGETTPATVNFGNSLQTGTITGLKFNDTNGNGTQDTGEIGIPGVTIFLDTNNNGTSDTGETQVTTGTDGSYSFPNLETGTYNVREVVPTGFTPTTPNPRTVPLDPGQTSTANFGNQQVPPTPTPTPTPTPPQPPTPVQQSSISGLKFNDGNGNGTQDAEETGLSGWQIFLDANANNSLDSGETTVTTDNSGNYSFNNLNPGTYNVREVQQTGWTQTTANPAAVNLGSGESRSGINFGNFQNISISGSKFNDLNNNGVLDTQEPLLPNWQIFLDANSNNSLDAGEVNTSTDSLGGYSFANLGPGTYRVREVNQPGWTQTTANPADIIAVSGTNVSNINFGNSFAQAQPTPTPTPTPLPPQEGQDADCICSQIVLPSISSIRGPNSVTNTRNGTNGNDTIIGTNNGDEINGFDGDDLLAGLRGNDNIYGGLNSAFPVGPDIDRDLLFGNEGNDYLNGVAGDDLIFAGKNEDVVYGGKDDDIIFGDQESDTLIGDQGNDTIYGGTINPFDPDLTGNDLLFGLAGDDFLSGEKNQDTIASGDGDDTVRAGKGDDLVFGELGSNLLFGDEGSDTICGGEGEDTVYGDIGSPLPIGSAGGQDQICGGLGNDLLFGNEGQDTVNGEVGNDTLYGGKDEDSLLGSAGDDFLFGDQGNDTLIGGTGNDRFMLGIDLGSETILDFQYGIDSIGLMGGLDFSQLSIVAENSSTLIRVTGSGQLLATLSNVPASVITATDFALL
ncbi:MULTISPECIES: SdrD B-like domain-containing protein [unclassified Microcoleus]|uniref:SdrD B-like domain-containing protein n=1 Tax=unclassified Microcoleus TaxID=2642155 RepID=UPI002FD432C5